MKRNRTTHYVILGLSLVLLVTSLLPRLTAAAEYERYENGWVIVPPECIDPSVGTCGLNSLVQLFINLANVGLKVLPYLTMIMMIWAGFNLIMAGGNPEKVQSGKKMISSVLLGVIIVTVLAWAWSYFVVVILTGEYNLFPNTIFEKAWWGGGTVAEAPPGTGCCVINTLGCTNNTQEQCDSARASLQALAYVTGGTAPQVFWQGENQFCYEFPTQCKNYQFGCCVPVDPNNKTCYNGNERGCLDVVFPGAGQQQVAVTFNPTKCANLADRCENIVGEATTQTSDGCCVTGNSCNAGSSSTCSGQFYPGQSCNTVNDCTVGCCVGTASCSAGKINCTGVWNATSCTEAPNDTNCTIGCCEDTRQGADQVSCYTSMTVAACDARTGGSFIFDPSFANCQGLVECFNGCCTANNQCSSGNIDGSCPDPVNNYDANSACAGNPACDEGCCLFSDATTCTDGIIRDNCNGVFYGGFCSDRHECSTIGCCKDVINASGACIDGYADAACGGFPNEFHEGSCSDAPFTCP